MAPIAVTDVAFPLELGGGEPCRDGIGPVPCRGQLQADPDVIGVGARIAPARDRYRLSQVRSDMDPTVVGVCKFKTNLVGSELCKTDYRRRVQM
jgi:hypothetical protein